MPSWLRVNIRDENLSQQKQGIWTCAEAYSSDLTACWRKGEVKFVHKYANIVTQEYIQHVGSKYAEHFGPKYAQTLGSKYAKRVQNVPAQNNR
jgi:hypothetical protein